MAIIVYFYYNVIEAGIPQLLREYIIKINGGDFYV